MNVYFKVQVLKHNIQIL